MLTRRALLSVCTAAAASPLVAGPAPAQGIMGSWPTRPVRLVVPYAPGGPSDIVARAIQGSLQAALGQPVVVENRPGGGGMIGTEAAARADDHHTFLVADSPHTIIPAVQAQVPYDPAADFAPVSLLGGVWMVLMANPRFPAQTLPEFVAAAKARPDAVTFGSSGVGSLTHLLPEWFAQVSGVKFTTVPYRGSGPALLDVVAGQIDAIFSSTLSASGQLNEGRVRPVAATAPERLRSLPGVPTFREGGLDMVSSNWWGVLAPKGMPPRAVERMEAATRAALADPGVQERFASLGIDARPPGPAPFAELLAAEFLNWARIARTAGIRVQ
jgi:tripartite-type tricarboxylate transporter receptor subunit TctC